MRTRLPKIGVMAALLIIAVVWYNWGFLPALLAFFVGFFCKEYGLQAAREEAQERINE